MAKLPIIDKPSQFASARELREFIKYLKTLPQTPETAAAMELAIQFLSIKEARRS